MATVVTAILRCDFCAAKFGREALHRVRLLWERKSYAAPIGAFSCREVRAFTGFWGEISSTVSKVLGHGALKICS